VSVASEVVRHPVLYLIIFVLIALVGFFLLQELPTDMFPDVERPVINVRTSYPGAGPEIVEKTLTRLLETQFVNLSSLEKITSRSSEGSSNITLEFTIGTNLDDRKNEIRDRIDRIRDRLPEEAEQPRMFTFDPNAMPIVRFAVRGNRSVDELQQLAEDHIQHHMEQVDGVGSAEVMGGREQQVRVEIYQNRLEAFSLNITTIASALANANIELGAGSIEDGTRNYSIRTTGEFKTVQDIANTVIARRNNSDIRLLDIAEVSFGYPKERSAVYINGDPGVFVANSRQSGTNSVAIADRIYVKLDEVRETLPPDVELNIVRDSTTQIRDMIDELIESALLGALLAMLILALFLRNFKSVIIIGISIPFSILVTLLAMRFANLTLNMMTLSGLILGIGMVVDCSIVVIDNIFKYRERGAKPDISSILGSQEVMSSITAGTLTTLCVFIPLLLLQSTLGMIGSVLRELIITVSISLGSSLFVAIFLVPVLTSKFLPIFTRTQHPLKNPMLKAVDRFFEWILQSVTSGYGWLLAKSLRNRLVVCILVIGTFISAILIIPALKVVLMPQMNEDSVSVNIRLPSGSLYEDTKETLLQVQLLVLEQVKGIKNVVTNIGSTGFGGGNSASGSIQINLDLKAPGGDTSDDVQSKVRSIAQDFPNASFTFGQGRMGGMRGSDIDLVLHINEITPGIVAANEIKDLLATKVPDLLDLNVSMEEGLPELEIVIDRVRAYNLGLSISSIAREISAAMSGITASIFRFDGDEYNIVLELREEDKEKIADLDKILITSNTGVMVPVSNFARMERTVGPIRIERENQNRIIHITSSLKDSGKVFEVEEQIRELLTTEYIMPEGMYITYEGQAKEIRKNTGAFMGIILLALAMVYGVMAGVYESFKDPFINMFTIPLVMIGVIGVYFIVGLPISMFTLVGILMLVGLAVNNGIILVDFTNLLVGRGVPVMQACVDAGISRLRPVLMTSLTTGLGLVPLAFFPGSSARFTQPIGLSVIGGLFTSTLITLFLIPVLYSLLHGKDKKIRIGDNL